MFHTVLVGIDEQTRGSDAIALAKRLVSPNGEITFAHIYPPVVSATNISGGSAVDAAKARALLQSAAAGSGVRAQMRCAASVSVSDGLHNIALQIGADLLVLGSSTRTRLTRALLGNFTADTLATSDCTVAVAPQGYAEHAHEIQRVGVAYDGSSPSEAALSLAQVLAQSRHAELSAFKVVPPPHDGLMPRHREMAKAVNALRAGREQIEAHEGVEAHVGCGDPVRQLAGYSKTVDILVAGARGAGFLARVLHPSTTEALTDVVSCPLLVVTKAARLHNPIFTANRGATKPTWN